MRRSCQEILPGLYLGSFSAILDPGLLGAHHIAALMQVLDAPSLPSEEAHAARRRVLITPRISSRPTYRARLFSTSWSA